MTDPDEAEVRERLIRKAREYPILEHPVGSIEYEHWITDLIREIGRLDRADVEAIVLREFSRWGLKRSGRVGRT